MSCEDLGLGERLLAEARALLSPPHADRHKELTLAAALATAAAALEQADALQRLARRVETAARARPRRWTVRV